MAEDNMLGKLVGELKKSDWIAVVDLDGAHVEAQNEFHLSGRPNSRCIVSLTEPRMLLAITGSTGTVSVNAAGGEK